MASCLPGFNLEVILYSVKRKLEVVEVKVLLFAMVVLTKFIFLLTLVLCNVCLVMVY